MTIAELQEELYERSATLQIHGHQNGWTVLLYAPEDAAAAFFKASAPTLEAAITAALAAWGGASDGGAIQLNN
jgi:hypothetical protein